MDGWMDGQIDYPLCNLKSPLCNLRGYIKDMVSFM